MRFVERSVGLGLNIFFHSFRDESVERKYIIQNREQRVKCHAESALYS